MKHIVNVGLSTIFLLGIISVSQAQTAGPEQPLGDYARSVKKEKKQPTKSFDNDNLPMQDSLSVVGNTEAAPQTADASTQSTTQNADGELVEGSVKPPAAEKRAPKVETPKITPGESEADRQKVFDKWQDKLSNQQEKVEMLSREIDVMQKEQKLKATEFYSDAGARLRDSGNWDKQLSEFQQQLQEKQKALAEAKDTMNDMQEDARKSGVPSSVIEKTGAPQN